MTFMLAILAVGIAIFILYGMVCILIPRNPKGYMWKPQHGGFQDKMKGMIKMAGSGLKQVKEFFGMSLVEMKAEWVGTDAPEGKKLTDKDREEILTAIQSGTLTY